MAREESTLSPAHLVTPASPTQRGERRAYLADKYPLPSSCFVSRFTNDEYCRSSVLEVAAEALMNNAGSEKEDQKGELLELLAPPPSWWGALDLARSYGFQSK